MAPTIAIPTSMQVQKSTLAIHPDIDVSVEQGTVIVAPSAMSSSDAVARIFKLVVSIVGVMALGAMVVSAVVLDHSLALLGFCVALMMMLFIGLPLILASLGDAVE